MKVKLRLDTLSDINKFARITSGVSAPVQVIDDAGHCVNAKSILGMMYSMEWSEIWCTCDEDIYEKIKDFVI